MRSEMAARPLSSSSTRAYVIGLAASTLAGKLPTLSVPPWWDEVRYVEQAHWLAERSLATALPGLHPPAQFFGHPTGLHATLAAIWKITGPSVPVAHLLIALFAAVGVCATFLLGRYLYGTTTGVLAAALLLLSPIWFAQSGMYLADVPVAALAVLSVYLALSDRYVAYVLCASYMVLLKETAAAVIVALVVYRVLCSGPISRQRLREAPRYGLPLLAIGAFVIAQKLTTGRFFFIYTHDISLVTLTPAAVLNQLRTILRWIFTMQLHWLLTAAIALDLLVNGEPRRRRELWLFGLILVTSGLSFSILYFLPRYLLPVMPFFFIMGAAAITDLVRPARARIATVAVVSALMVWSLLHQPMWGNGEFNLTYVRIVRLQQEAAREIEARYPGARILTTSRLSTQLGTPMFGYVERPLQVVDFRSDSDTARTDVILVTTPETTLEDDLWRLARASGWTLASHAEDGSASVATYVAPDWRERAIRR